MLFMTAMEVQLPNDMSTEAADDLRARERERAYELQRAGKLKHIWRVAGRYANVVAVRVVTSEDAMTADWARLPPDVLSRISNRIVNEVAGVNRVVLDITPKPPGTIEWE